MAACEAGNEARGERGEREREKENEATERTSVDLDFKFQAKEAHISPR